MLRYIVAVGFLFVLGGEIWAIAPQFVSDDELAQFPIIVVAKWEKAPFRANHRYDKRDEQKVITAIESFTTLNVLRVVSGDVQPGTHTLMVGWGITWSEDGRRVTSGTSTEMPGEVQDVTEPNIWFLQKRKSWDDKDKTEHLSVSNYRAIQPTVLKPYYAALVSAHPEKEVAKLLTSINTEVVRRSLLYISGGLWPWPHDSDFETNFLGQKQGKLLHDLAGAVLAVIKRDDLKEVRALAVAVYAKLEGTKCVRSVRVLLEDQDSSVRAAAVAVLTRYRDRDSLPGIIRTVTGRENGWVACKIIEAMSEWGDVRLVPALVAYLESGELAYQYGNDLGIPALKAREVLHRMTGHWFPYSVEASRRAWEEAGQLSDFGKRQQLLATILPSDPNPLKAEVIGDGSTNAFCRIVNKSRQDVVVARCPAWGEQSWPGSSAGTQIGTGEPKDMEDLIVLKPGESTQCKLVLQKGFLLADPSSRRLTLQYRLSGKEWEIKAWIGSIEAEFGAEWKEQRKIENVDEKWPNGNLKAKGQTMNGEKYGEWQYFNEEGDRIKRVNYTGARGTAICNPEHPDNKGAGKQRVAK